VALPKAHRLRKREDFNIVYQLGLRRSTPHLTLRAWHQPVNASDFQSSCNNEAAENVENGDQLTCFGISISQKVSKRAVVRNRMKRQIHAALHQLLPRVTPSWKVVIVVRPPAIQCDYESFLQELEQLLISAEVINGH
jgi:ribonuclease P protein component